MKLNPELSSFEILIKSIRRCLPNARVCANCRWWRREKNNYGKIEYFCVGDGNGKQPTGPLHSCSCLGKNCALSFKKRE